MLTGSGKFIHVESLLVARIVVGLIASEHKIPYVFLDVHIWFVARNELKKLVSLLVNIR